LKFSIEKGIIGISISSYGYQEFKSIYKAGQ